MGTYDAKKMGHRDPEKTIGYTTAKGGESFFSHDARDASEKANVTGTQVDHEKAADLHRKAAKGSSDPAVIKEHTDAAAEHDKAATKMKNRPINPQDVAADKSAAAWKAGDKARASGKAEDHRAAAAAHRDAANSPGTKFISGENKESHLKAATGHDAKAEAAERDSKPSMGKTTYKTALAGASGNVKPPVTSRKGAPKVEKGSAGWDESKHPRAGGKFTSK